MTLGRSPGTRTAFIALSTLLMAASIYVLGQTLREGSADDRGVRAPARPSGIDRPITREAAVFRLSGRALAIAAQPAVDGEHRALEKAYTRRAYPGAPPIVPHAVPADMDRTRASCLGCHEAGGFVAEFKTFAPVTPHPELASCRQCHVPAAVQESFRDSDWQPPRPPRLKQAALPGSPPVIPHALEMRENCLGCHGGSGAAKEIRTRHPERVNCRQCHVAIETSTRWPAARQE